MEREARAPKITNLSWGSLEVEGQGRSFKDAKLFPGGAKEWDWNVTGTSHEPGVQIADIEELLERGVGVMILGNGFHERLQVCRETFLELKKRNVPVHVEPSEKAVRLYNTLRESKRVGALIHTTC